MRFFVWVCSFIMPLKQETEIPCKWQATTTTKKKSMAYCKHFYSSHHIKNYTFLALLFQRRCLTSSCKRLHAYLQSVSFPFQSTYLSILTHNYVYNAPQKWLKSKDVEQRTVANQQLHSFCLLFRLLSAVCLPFSVLTGAHEQRVKKTAKIWSDKSKMSLCVCFMYIKQKWIFGIN